ncbi:MAG: helix-turn-helix domain-containing protein [Bacteroidia bacterium]|nr:helix-turn-helix domain-containing protein [Bacteroidia bacterium]
MAVHIGKKIKEEVYKQGISVSAFAKKISRSRNVVYDIFERESVDTDLLNKIGKVLNCDFFSLYSAQKEYAQGGVKTFHINEQEAGYPKINPETFSAMQQENQILKNEIAYLKKIISLLETKKSTKGPKK